MVTMVNFGLFWPFPHLIFEGSSRDYIRLRSRIGTNQLEKKGDLKLSKAFKYLKQQTQYLSRSHGDRKHVRPGVSAADGSMVRKMKWRAS